MPTRGRQQEQWEALPGQFRSCPALLCHQYQSHCCAQGAALAARGLGDLASSVCPLQQKALLCAQPLTSAWAEPGWGAYAQEE